MRPRPKPRLVSSTTPEAILALRIGSFATPGWRFVYALMTRAPGSLGGSQRTALRPSVFVCFINQGGNLVQGPIRQFPAPRVQTR